eukprot:4268796-Pyramimonas_sp.AAC.1
MHLAAGMFARATCSQSSGRLIIPLLWLPHVSRPADHVRSDFGSRGSRFSCRTRRAARASGEL